MNEGLGFNSKLDLRIKNNHLHASNVGIIFAKSFFAIFLLSNKSITKETMIMEDNLRNLVITKTILIVLIHNDYFGLDMT